MKYPLMMIFMTILIDILMIDYYYFDIIRTIIIKKSMIDWLLHDVNSFSIIFMNVDNIITNFNHNITTIIMMNIVFIFIFSNSNIKHNFDSLFFYSFCSGIFVIINLKNIGFYIIDFGIYNDYVLFFYCFY